jgi:hypothetical protein
MQITLHICQHVISPNPIKMTLGMTKYLNRGLLAKLVVIKLWKKNNKNTRIHYLGFWDLF